jgi:hypothetical protein
MSNRRHLISLAGAGIVVLSSVALAACGSGGGTATQTPPYGGPASTTSQQSMSQTTSGKVSTASTSLGTVLVDSQGRTLYLFKADQGTEERMLWRVRERMAAASGERKADGQRWGNGIEAGNDSAL